MNINDIEAIANNACFAVDQKVKSQAERMFVQFCSQMDLSQIHSAMINFSQTVLFVLMEFLYKADWKNQDVLEIFQIISKNAELWFQESGVFIRNDNKPLQKFVENSLGRTIGFFIKLIFTRPNSQNQIIEKIKQKASPRYRLFLWKSFIQAVEPVDSSMAFLAYRTMIYSFQDNIIPIITEQLIPYFHKVEDNIKVNELSTTLQSAVSMENVEKKVEKGLLFTSDQIKFTELVFFILREIITFNYNITFSEYDSGQTFQSCLICFPEAVTKKMTSQQFLQSIFFVTEKLMNEMPNSNFFSDVFDCIKKLMMSKLTYTSSEVKRVFIMTVLEGMNRLFNVKNITQRGLLHLLQSNNKFIANIEMHEIREFEQQFLPWITSIQNLILKVIQCTPLNINNLMLTQALQLTSKIVSQSISPQLKNDFLKFKELGTKIANAFLQNFLAKDIEILGQTKLRDIDELKKHSSNFFKPIKTLVSIDLEKSLNIIENGLESSLVSENINQIVNSFLMMTEFCDGKVFEKNFLYDSPDPKELRKFGKILDGLFSWIQSYRRVNQVHGYIDVGLLIFIEKILSQCLSELNWENSMIVIKSKLYLSIKEMRRNLKEEEFLIYCFSQITRNLHTEDAMRIQYTLDILKPLLAKFKWALKRQNFKQTTIAREMTRLCYQISQKSLGDNLLKWRKKLFNILTALNFDDVLDSYRDNIDQLIHQMVNNLNINQWKVLYDLTGVCESIDTITIYKYFLTRLQKFIGISKLTSSFYEKSRGDPEILKPILKLNLSMLTNKCQRLSGTKNSHRVYQLIQVFMPYWTELLEKFLNEETYSINLQLYRIFNCIAKEGHVNFYLLMRLVPCYNTYLLNLLKNMNSISGWVQQYPKLMKAFRQSMKIFCMNLPEVLLGNSPQITREFHELIFFFLKLNINQMQAFLDGNKNIEEQMLNSFEFLKSLFGFLKNGSRLVHKHEQIQNIKIIYSEKIEIKCEYIYNLLKFGISKGNISTECIRYIASLIQNISPIIDNNLGIIINKLGLKDSKKESLERIWSEGNEEEYDEDSFIHNMKDWLMNCEKESVPEGDYEY